MKIAVASFNQETNTFSSEPTTIDNFNRGHLYQGNEVIKYLTDTGTEIGGFLNVLRDEQVEVIPLMCAWAICSGPVEQGTFNRMSDELADQVDAAGPLDGLLIALHGAMVVDGEDDAEGVLLSKLRHRQRDLRIGCSLDWHANLTDKMLLSATFFIGYQTYPHQDLFETGERVAKQLCRMIREDVALHCYAIALPMIVSVLNSQSDRSPMKEIWGQLQRLEGRNEVMSCSLFCPHPWLDIANFNTRLVSYTYGESPALENGLRGVALRLWEAREGFHDRIFMPVKESIERATETMTRPILLIDTGDIAYAGAPGDSPVLLTYFLDSTYKAVLPICDLSGVRTLRALEPGTTVEMEVGGKSASGEFQPIHVKGELVTISDSPYHLRGPFFNGVAIAEGCRVVLKTGSVTLVLAERPPTTLDPSYYTSLGIELNAQDIVVIKSHHTFKPAYRKLSQSYCYVFTPGVTTLDLEKLQYGNIPRPMFPLDRGTEFTPEIKIL